MSSHSLPGALAEKWNAGSADTPALTLVVLAPEYGWENASREVTRRLVERILHEYGGRGRTFKSGLLFVVPEDGGRWWTMPGRS